MVVMAPFFVHSGFGFRFRVEALGFEFRVQSVGLRV